MTRVEDFVVKASAAVDRDICDEILVRGRVHTLGVAFSPGQAASGVHLARRAELYFDDLRLNPTLGKCMDTVADVEQLTQKRPKNKYNLNTAWKKRYPAARFSFPPSHSRTVQL